MEKEVQDVRIKGKLHAAQSVLSIIRDVLIIILCVVAIWQVINLSSELNKLKSNQGSTQGNQLQLQSQGQGTYGQGNQYPIPNQGYGNGPQAMQGNEDEGRKMAEQMHNYVQQGNWDAAMDQLNKIRNNVKVPSEKEQGIKDLEQAIKNKDTATFENIYNQLIQ